MTRKSSPEDFIVFPRTVLVDSREQLPFPFVGLRADARQGRKLLIIPTEVRGLASGDYSLDGYENRIAVERKSMVDLFQSVTRERERFERELERLNEFQSAYVVLECEWGDILNNPPPDSGVLPKTIHRSIMAFTQRYPRVHWWPNPGRAIAEITTFRLLEMFLRKNPPESQEGSPDSLAQPALTDNVAGDTDDGREDADRLEGSHARDPEQT
jgi:DNA excision repair protein ERCC-4